MDNTNPRSYTLETGYMGSGPGVLEPLERHTHTMIFLHGRGSSANEICSELFDEDSFKGQNLRERFPSWRWVFPNANTSFNTQFQEDMQQWYDTEDHDLTRVKDLSVLRDRNSLRYAVKDIHSIIDDELEHAPASRIFVGGISMGCAAAMTALLTYETKLAGFVGLCGWLPFRDEFKDVTESTWNFKRGSRLWKIAETYDDKLWFGNGARCPLGGARDNTKPAIETPIFLGHSKGDPVVYVDRSREMREIFLDLQMKITYKEYKSDDHWIKEPEGVDDIIEFLEKQVKAAEPRTWVDLNHFE